MKNFVLIIFSFVLFLFACSSVFFVSELFAIECPPPHIEIAGSCLCSTPSFQSIHYWNFSSKLEGRWYVMVNEPRSFWYKPLPNEWGDACPWLDEVSPWIIINAAEYVHVGGSRYLNSTLIAPNEHPSCSGVPPVCNSYQRIFSPCNCGCVDYSDDICRNRPESAVTCDYSCPAGSVIGAGGHCYKNGLRCLNTSCPAECVVAGCSQGYTLNVADNRCYRSGDGDMTGKGVLIRNRLIRREGSLWHGSGGYEIHQ